MQVFVLENKLFAFLDVVGLKEFLQITLQLTQDPLDSLGNLLGLCGCCLLDFLLELEDIGHELAILNIALLLNVDPFDLHLHKRGYVLSIRHAWGHQVVCFSHDWYRQSIQHTCHQGLLIYFYRDETISEVVWLFHLSSQCRFRSSQVYVHLFLHRKYIEVVNHLLARVALGIFYSFLAPIAVEASLVYCANAQFSLS